MTGLLITSFRQAMANLIMTLTTFNPYVGAVMGVSKTEHSNELPGETPGINRGRGKTVGVGRVLNDLLPYELRPIQSRHRRTPTRYGWRAELYGFKRVWHSHHKPGILKVLARMKLKQK